MVKSMNSTKQHKKVQLSGNNDCSVMFCPDCGIFEVSLGAITLRFNHQSFNEFNTTLVLAKKRIIEINDAINTEKTIHSASLGHVH